jgi:hypothetical protein
MVHDSELSKLANNHFVVKSGEDRLLTLSFSGKWSESNEWMRLKAEKVMHSLTEDEKCGEICVDCGKEMFIDCDGCVYCGLRKQCTVCRSTMVEVSGGMVVCDDPRCNEEFAEKELGASSLEELDNKLDAILCLPESGAMTAAMSYDEL